MLFPVEKLIEDKEKPLCVSPDETIESAVGLMIQHDFSQLPIVDENGNLLGMISEQSILRADFHTGGNISLMSLPVNHCLEKTEVVKKDDDIFKVIELLENQYSVVVVDGRSPLAILTFYDMNKFFRDISEGLILVEDIELTLRQSIETVYPEEGDYLSALKRSIGSNQGVSRSDNKQLSELTLWEITNLISHKANWDGFKHLFSSREIFMQYMEKIREIRNQLMHFRGELDPLQKDCLQNARQWLESRQRLPIIPEVDRPKMRISPNVEVHIITNKYDYLRNWFEGELPDQKEVQLGFDQIEQIIGEKLPRSAEIYRSWWENDPNSHVQSRAWMEAGWAVANVDFENKAVLFKANHYAKMQVVFTELLNLLKKKMPDATSANKVSPQNWFAFSAKSKGMNYAWVFNNRGELHVELYIDRQDKEENKIIFDGLKARSSEIENSIGAPLRWERLDNKNACRISLGTPINIDEPLYQLNDTKIWALEHMIKFIDIFKPYIRDL